MPFDNNKLLRYPSLQYLQVEHCQPLFTLLLLPLLLALNQLWRGGAVKTLASARGENTGGGGKARNPLSD